MASLQENVEIIKASINRMKEALGVELTTSLEEITVAVEQGGGSSGTNFSDFNSYTILLYNHLYSGNVEGLGVIKLYRTTQTDSIGLYRCFEISPKGETIRRAIDVYEKTSEEEAISEAESMKESYKYYSNIYNIASQGRFVFMDHNQNSEIGKTYTEWAEGLSFLSPQEITSSIV